MTPRLKHGACTRERRTPEYNAWLNMLRRCHYAPEGPYKRKKITVCDEWRSSFEKFFAHVGPKPKGVKTSLDRIDNAVGYQPNNVRWATKKQQDRNRETNRNITINGTTKTLTEWIEHSGLNPGTVRSRIHRDGWKPERAITTKYDGRRRKRKP